MIPLSKKAEKDFWATKSPAVQKWLERVTWMKLLHGLPIDDNAWCFVSRKTKNQKREPNENR